MRLEESASPFGSVVHSKMMYHVVSTRITEVSLTLTLLLLIYQPKPGRLDGTQLQATTATRTTI